MGLTTSLRAPKVPSAWECPPPGGGRIQPGDKLDPTGQHAGDARSGPHIPKSSTLDAKHSAILHLSIAWMRPITTIDFTALAECHTKLAPWHACRKMFERCWCLGVPNAAARQQTAACVSGHGSQTACAKDPSWIKALPSNGTAASGGQVVNFPTGAGKANGSKFRAEVISVSPCLTANALAENRSPVSPPYRRKLVRCVEQCRSCVTFARPPEEAGLFFDAPGMARTAVAIRPEWCPVDDLEVRVLSWAPSLF